MFYTLWNGIKLQIQHPQCNVNPCHLTLILGWIQIPFWNTYGTKYCRYIPTYIRLKSQVNKDIRKKPQNKSKQKSKVYKMVIKVREMQRKKSLKSVCKVVNRARLYYLKQTKNRWAKGGQPSIIYCLHFPQCYFTTIIDIFSYRDYCHQSVPHIT